MYEKTLLAHKRFSANMRRVSRLINLAMSNQGQFKAVGFWTYDEIGADIFRVIVVFLHAAVEDLVRSHVVRPRSFTFSVADDIFKALRKANYDPSPLEELRKPLEQFAKRRHRIVHEADLDDGAEDVAQWMVVDTWLLMQWLITIVAFQYKFLAVVTQPTALYTTRYQLARKALDQNVALGHALSAIPNNMREQIQNNDLVAAKAFLQELSDRLTAMSSLFTEMKTIET
jgi:hypothetical protein